MKYITLSIPYNGSIIYLNAKYISSIEQKSNETGAQVVMNTGGVVRTVESADTILAMLEDADVTD